MNQNNRLTRANPRDMSHNVYCGYSDRDHNILCQRRIMCSPFIGTENHTFSNPHQITWSQLQARSVSSNIGSVHDAVIGGVALAILAIAISLV